MRILFLIIFLTFQMSLAKAEVVKKIIIENNDRVSKETIITFSNVNLNDNISQDDLNDVLKRLYETKFFSDVKVSLKNNELKIFVTENKIVQQIIIKGIKAKKIQEAILEKVKLKEKSPYNEFIAKQDINYIRNNLNKIGYYFAEIKSFISENPNNTINLVYEINLGEKAIIGKIEFTGQKVFKNRKLRNIITSEEGRFWKFISNKKYLNEQQIKLDERLLNNFYLNNGYYNVKVNSVYAQLLDTGEFKLSYNINAGNIYKINKTNLLLPKDYDEENFLDVKKTLKKLETKRYSFNRVSKVVDEIDKVSLRKQYEFINASINAEVVDDNLINLTFEISETERKFVERINIYGNNVTEEKVIRNQIITDEGDPYNKLLEIKSINNIKGLNIFKSVKSKVEDGSTPQQKIINIAVEEKPTGEIALGAGVGTDGTTLGFAVTENNYLGKGIRLNTSLRLSQDTVRGRFQVDNPDWRSSGRALSTNIQSTSVDKLSDNGYKSNKTGFSFGTRFEQYENVFISPNISAYSETLSTNSSASENLKKQEGSYLDTSLDYAINYDVRNQSFMPTEGFRSVFYQSLPIYSDDFSVTNGYEFTNYYKLPNEMVTMFSIYGRAVSALKDGKDVRVSERLRLPRKKLKGFETGKIGPVDGNDYIGGNYSTALNFSTTLPMFLQSVQTADVSYFLDVGNVWGVDYSSKIDDSNKFRSSTGVSVNWFTPIGPLSFSVAHPLSQTSTDKTQRFQFQIGTTF